MTADPRREAEFMNLLEPHVTAIRRMVRSMVRNDSDADDVLQQTFLKAYKYLHQFRYDASFKTWLSRIAINESRQVDRKRRCGRLCSFDQATADGMNLAPDRETPLVVFQRRENYEMVHRALARLPRIYRTVVELRDVKELSVIETARHLNVTTSTVKTRHRRARLQLQKHLSYAAHGFAAERSAPPVGLVQ